MRKVLSFVLVLSLVLGSLGMAFAGSLSDIKGKDFEDAVNVLTELGVVKGYPDGTYKPDKIVTRAEMAVIVVSALGLADYATGTANFKDMAGHWANPYVAYANSLGVIAGYPDGTFKPDKTVSYDEAATMLVAALGYTPDSLIGTWPTNFVSKAKTLGILDGIKAGAAGANRGDIALMAFQTLDQSTGKTDKDGVWNPTILKAGPPAVYETLLDRLGVELYDPDGVGPLVAGAPFLLTNLLADTAVTNVRGYVGAWITAYVNADDEIIAIKDVKSTFLTGKFTASSNAATIGANDKFEANDVEYVFATAALVNPPDYLNGKGGPNITFNTNDEFTLAVEVSGKTIKNVYSAAAWAPTAADKVSNSQLGAITKDMKLLAKSFKKDDNKEIDLKAFDLVGVDSLSDIKADDVVFVYDNTTITKVAVSNKVVSGEITKLKGGKYTIDGVAYEVYSGVGAKNPSLKVGDEVKAFIGPDGKIFDSKLIKGEADKIGIILSTGDATTGSGLNNSDAQVKLFLADGTNKTFVVNEDVYIAAEGNAVPGLIGNDGVWGATTPDNAVGAGGFANLVGVAVKYDVNKDGEINDLTRVTLNVSPGINAKLFKNETFQGYRFASNPLIISYTKTGGVLPYTGKAADYSVLNLSNLLDTDLKNAYYTLDDNKQIDFLYISADTSSTDNIYAVLVGAEKNNTDAGWGVDLLVDGVAVYKDSKNDERGSLKTSLYKVTYDSKGVATLAAHGIAGAQIKTASSPQVSGLVVKVPGGASFTLDKDVIVYVLNADGEYEVGSVSDIEDGDVTLYDTNSTPDGIYDIVLVVDDVTAPAVVSATFLSATKLEIVFNEAVNAVMGDFTDGKVTVGPAATFTVSAVAGSGTNTIILTVAGNVPIVAGNGGSVDIAGTVTDLEGNALGAVNDQVIVAF